MDKTIRDYRIGLGKVLDGYGMSSRINDLLSKCDNIKGYINAISIDDTLLVFGVNTYNRVELIVEGVDNYNHSARNWLLKKGIMKTMQDDIHIGNWDRGTEYGVENESTLKKVKDFTMWLCEKAGNEGYHIRWFSDTGSNS